MLHLLTTICLTFCTIITADADSDNAKSLVQFTYVGHGGFRDKFPAKRDNENDLTEPLLLDAAAQCAQHCNGVTVEGREVSFTIEMFDDDGQLGTGKCRCYYLTRNETFDEYFNQSATNTYYLELRQNIAPDGFTPRQRLQATEKGQSSGLKQIEKTTGAEMDYKTALKHCAEECRSAKRAPGCKSSIMRYVESFNWHCSLFKFTKHDSGYFKKPDADPDDKDGSWYFESFARDQIGKPEREKAETNTHSSKTLIILIILLFFALILIGCFIVCWLTRRKPKEGVLSPRTSSGPKSKSKSGPDGSGEPVTVEDLDDNSEKDSLTQSERAHLKLAATTIDTPPFQSIPPFASTTDKSAKDNSPLTSPPLQPLKTKQRGLIQMPDSPTQNSGRTESGTETITMHENDTSPDGEPLSKSE